MKDVHTEHCCKDHGCKYGEDDQCSVMQGRKQSYPCEQCSQDADLTPEEKAKKLGVKLIPKIPEEQRKQLDPNPPVGVCGECGITLHKVMHYVCNKAECPCFPRVTMSAPTAS